MILREVGLSRSTFYYYFKSKHELLTMLVASIYDELARECTAEGVTEEPHLGRDVSVMVALAKQETAVSSSSRSRRAAPRRRTRR
jgi:AcrR family transcriptional regulator